MRNIYFKGELLTLEGRLLTKDMPSPEFRVINNDLKDVVLKDFSGKIKVISTFPSLDTPICDLQVKEFNKQAVSLSEDVVVIGISKDLPFAQRRFCELNNIRNVKVFSDYKYSSFGINYGLLIRELNLLARSVLIIDKANNIRYIQIVMEITEQPDYKDVINNLEEVLKTPVSADTKGLSVSCKPCEAGVSSLSKNEVDELMVQSPGWELIDGKKIRKEFKFKDFADTKYFLDLISIIIEEQGHHPILTLNYDKLKVTLTTNATGGLTENDFIMAKIFDDIKV